MKGHRFLEAMGNIDKSFAIEALEWKKDEDKKRKRGIVTGGVGVIAMLFVVVLSVFLVEKYRKQNKSNNMTGKNVESSETTKSPVVSPEDTPLITRIATDKDILIFQAKTYYHVCDYVLSEQESVKAFLEESIGEAVLSDLSGNSKAWDINEEKRGNVYTLKGYDVDFRIAVLSEKCLEEGEKKIVISCFDEMDGFLLKQGKTIYEDRLKIRSRIELDECKVVLDGKERDLQLSQEEWEGILVSLDENTIEYGNGASPLSLGGKENRVRQAIVFLSLNDGTEIRLYVTEEGTISYWNFSACSVNVPKSVVAPLFK